jgi:hypothetical protein
MITRPLTLDLWSVAHERMTARQAVGVAGHTAPVSNRSQQL